MNQPLDRLITMTDYFISQHKVKQTKKRHYSETLGEHYRVKLDGSIVFTSGVVYTRQELEKLKDASDADKKQIHNIKKIFKGGQVI